MFEDPWVDFYSPCKIHFELDSAFKIGGFIQNFGNRVLLINIRKENKNDEELQIIKNGLQKHSEGCIIYDDLYGDPDTEQIDSATYFAKKSHADMIIAYGGLDSFNTARAVSILATNSLFAKDLLNGRGKIKVPALPIISVPIEPTMGEELSNSFTLIDAESGVRRFFSHDSLFAKACFYDPKICNHLSSDEAAKVTGAQLAYAIESALSSKTSPLSTTMSLRAIDSMKKNMTALYRDPTEEKLITNVLWASSMIGMALPSSPLGVTWSIATALSTETRVDFHHGMSLILPHVMEYYLTAAPNRYVNIARSLEEDVKDISIIEAAIKAVEGVRKQYLEVNLPMRLQEFEVKKSELGTIAQVASTYSQLENAPRKLSKNEIESILVSAS